MSATYSVWLDVLHATVYFFLALAQKLCIFIPEENAIMCLVCIFVGTRASLMIKCDILRLLNSVFFSALKALCSSFSSSFLNIFDFEASKR